MVKRIAGIFFARSIPAVGVIVLTLIAPLVSDVERAAVFLTGMALLYVLGIVARFGLDIYVLKGGAARFQDKCRLVSLEEVVFLLLCALFSFLLIAIYYLLSSYYDIFREYSWVFYALPAFSCQGILSSFLKAMGDEFWGAMTEPSISSLLTVVIFFGLQGGGGVELGVAYLYAIWFVFIVTLIYIGWGFSFVYASGFNVGKGLIDSWVFFLNQISSYALQWYPLFLLGGMDKKFVVYYAVANRMATVISFIGVTIDSFSAPRFSNYWKERNLLSLQALRKKMMRLSRGLAILCFFSVGLVSYVYGAVQVFDASYSVMAFTLIACYAASIGFGPNGFFLVMTDYGHYVTRVSFFVLLVVVILSSLLFMVDAPVMMAVSVGGAVLVRSSLFYLKVRRTELN